MRKLWSGIATVLFYVISASLLAYAATRSLDFIVSTLPADKMVIGYFALAATSGGAIAWLLMFLHKSSGLGQKITAAIMVGVDLLGEITLFTMDTLYRSAENGIITSLSPEEIRATVLGLSALVGLNLIALFAYHLSDPENLREMQESFARATVLNAVLKDIEKRSEELAAQLAPQLGEQWADEFTTRWGEVGQWGLAQWGQTGYRRGWAALGQKLGLRRKNVVGANEPDTKIEAEHAPIPVPVQASGNGRDHSPSPLADAPRTYEAADEDAPRLDPTGDAGAA